MKKGFTLIEVLVSLFIFTLVILAAYKIYDHSQRTYLMGEQLTDTQQGVRFSFEKVSLDLRTAGYHVYPDSDALRTDLPIEGMWSGAIAVRADYDRQEETVLECTKNTVTNICNPGTGQFGLVTTGNRDLRVYVLKSPFPLGHANYDAGETISFKADFSRPRDAIVGDPGTLETVNLPNVCLTQAKPPYKLYMVTFIPADSTDPAYNVPDGDNVPADHIIWTPIADGIFSMHFDYYNQNGVAEANRIVIEAFGSPVNFDPPDASAPSDWPNYRRTHGWPFGGSGAGGGNVVKNAIVTIIGMTARDDGRYTDPVLSAPDFTTKYTAEQQAAYTLTKMKRKYELTSTLNLLNVGVAPHELADTVPPDDPTQLEEVTGYCGGVLLTWNPSLAQDMAVYWLQVVDAGLWSTWGGTGFKYNCDDAPNTCYPTSNPESYASGRVGFYIRNLTNNADYHSRVFAQDSAGNFSRNPSNEIEFTIDPHPLKPLGAVVTGGAAMDLGGLQRLQITFTPPQDYDTDPQNDSCIGDVSTKDGRWPTLRDLYGYRLYHRRQLAAVPTDMMDAPLPTADEKVADETSPAANPLKIPAVQYPDIKACPCEYYAYKMKSVTQCTDADDDTTQTPPCVHTGDTSLISQDADGNPVAYLAPEYQPYGTYPQIVPAQPQKPGGVAVPATAPNYDITLQLLPVLTSALKSDIGDFSANPAANQQVEVWRYRIYEYTEDPDVLGRDTEVEVLDTDIGPNDYADWDAGWDADPKVQALGAATPIKFKITRPLPVGQVRWYAVSGIYRCAGGIYEGPKSLAVAVPCDASWSAVITSPAVDYTLVNSPSTDYTIVATVTGLVAPTTITGMTLTIGNGGGVTNEPLTVTCGPGSCTASFVWHLLGLPDGDYPILLSAVDNQGCSNTVSRIATINEACAAFQVWTVKPPAGNMLTWEFRKVNGTDVFLLDKIGFRSQTYLTTLLNFYPTDPNATTPPATTLWSGGATNLNGKTIGLSGTDFPYASVNLCNTEVARALDLNPYPYETMPSGVSNWFRATYDQNINSSLNLYGSFYGRKCMPTTTTIAMTAGGTKSLILGAAQLPLCAWEWTGWSGGSGKRPDVDATNICNGTIVFKGKTGMNAAGTITLTYWTPSGPFSCPNMPILIP